MKDRVQIETMIERLKRILISYIALPQQADLQLFKATIDVYCCFLKKHNCRCFFPTTYGKQLSRYSFSAKVGIHFFEAQ